MTEPSSYPFFNIARRIGVPYADVLMFKDVLIGLTTDYWVANPHQVAAVERLTPDLQAQHIINRVLCDEMNRRDVVNGIVRPPGGLVDADDSGTDSQAAG